jgi:hypothetical protein
MGFCAGFDVPGNMNPGFNPRSRANYGFGFGMGRGNRWGFHATGLPGWARSGNWRNIYLSPAPASNMQPEMNSHDEVQYLKVQAKALKKTLEEINSRIDELSKTGEK